ncbi:peptidase S24/S26A/S26B/S26C family protein [Striga asiatica]|uniref:Peptidase S24/S26A/S26B/S26C family protein n=1 Tax=Striga asiatica TaxID=4170 RepID=A0A5A7PA06_STRAF|nr:peptidase S24/S26A/S26B/S26C family protein [Striga asiatica]
MVGLSTWFRYIATKFEYSVSLTRKTYIQGQIEDTEILNMIWRNVFHGKLTFLHWNKGEEMVPSIGSYDGTLLVRKIPAANPTRVHVGDMVVLKDPINSGNYLVRRLAAIEGFEMASTDEKDEPFLLENDQCWVLADNKDLNPKEAYDSRTFGPVTMENIVGRVIYCLRNAVDHGPVNNSHFSEIKDSPVLEVELDVEEMARNHKMLFVRSDACHLFEEITERRMEAFLLVKLHGSRQPNDRYLPCSGLSGRALILPPNSSHANYKLISNKTHLSLKCKFMKEPYNAGPNNSWQKPSSSKHNRRKDSDDGYKDQEEPDNSFLSSKNGPFVPFSSNRRSTTPGTREKEIVEIFKKVQAQLRERAALKKAAKKIEPSQEKNKWSERVDSLLKVSRKHSVQQGKKTTSSADNRDFNQQEQDKVQERTRQNLSRPKSSFQRRSPVPGIKFQPVFSQSSVNSFSHEKLERVNGITSLEPEAKEEALDVIGKELGEISGIYEELLSESDSEESDVDTLFSEGNELDELSGVYEEEENRVEVSDLSGMKLPELRALAKSRGLKGYSKLKKVELIELLRE